MFLIFGFLKNNNYAMQILTIQINDSKALSFLEVLESMKLIEVIKKSSATVKKKKLSERMIGSISHEQAQILHAELNQMRNGWERNI